MVALTTPATEAPVSSSTAARNRNTATMCAPTVPSAVEAPQYSASPTTPPRGRTHSGSQRTSEPPGPSPSVPAARPSAQRREQAQPAGAERPHGGQHLAQHEDRARGQQRHRHAVVDGADQPAQAVDGPAAGLAAVPAEVDQEREEDRGGHQRRARSGRAGAARAWAGGARPPARNGGLGLGRGLRGMWPPPLRRALLRPAGFRRAGGLPGAARGVAAQLQGDGLPAVPTAHGLARSRRGSHLVRDEMPVAS